MRFSATCCSCSREGSPWAATGVWHVAVSSKRGECNVLLPLLTIATSFALLSIPQAEATGAFGCNDPARQGPIQVLDRQTAPTDYYNAKVLRVQDGSYTQVFEIHNDLFPFVGQYYLNSCGMSPANAGIHRLYCTTYFVASGSTTKISYIVRVSDDGSPGTGHFKWVARITDNKPGVVGTFDSTGDFWVRTGSGYYRYPGVDALPVFDTYTDLDSAIAGGATANDFRNTAAIGLGKGGNDIINLVADLANTGTPQEYLVSIKTKWGQSTGYQPVTEAYAFNIATMSVSTLTPVLDQSKPTQEPHQTENYGAGWNYGGKIFFSANSGTDGVYELEFTAALFAAGSFGLRSIGQSAATQANDGANCPNAPIPFPTCGNKDATSGVAVTDGECGTGFIYDATAAASVCDDAAVGCDVSTVGAGDHNRCCKTGETGFAPTCGETTEGGSAFASCNAGREYDSSKAAVENPSDAACCKTTFVPTCGETTEGGSAFASCETGTEYDSTKAAETTIDSATCCFTPTCGNMDGANKQHTCATGIYDATTDAVQNPSDANCCKAVCKAESTDGMCGPDHGHTVCTQDKPYCNMATGVCGTTP